MVLLVMELYSLSLFLTPAMAYSDMYCKDIPFTVEDTKVDKVFFPHD